MSSNAVHGKSLRPALWIYALPNSIIIDKLDPIQSALTLQGDQPQAPLKSLKFELASSDYGKARWMLEGLPVPPRQPALPKAGQ